MALIVRTVMALWLMVGCTFCSVSGSGDMIVAPEDPLPIQFQKEIDMMHQKWPGVAQYIVYFQNFTNTHAPLAVIKERFEQVVNLPGVVGLSIGDTSGLFA